MTRNEWDAEWWRVYEARYQKTRQQSKSFDYAHEYMVRIHGHRPEEELKKPGLLDLAKTGLTIRKGLSMQKPSVSAVLAAISLAASAAGAAYSAAFSDGVVVGGEWIAIVWAGVSALVAGLFTSPSKNV